MILDQLGQSDLYRRLHAAFAAGFDFLRSPNLAALPDGRHDLDGDRLFALVAHGAGRGRAASKLEAHRKYIDIQYVVQGVDEIGWRPQATCSAIETPYDDARDIEFYRDDSESWLILPAGTFAIFFPSDAHAPLAGSGAVHKVVVKVAASE